MPENRRRVQRNFSPPRSRPGSPHPTAHPAIPDSRFFLAAGNPGGGQPHGPARGLRGGVPPMNRPVPPLPALVAALPTVWAEPPDAKARQETVQFVRKLQAPGGGFLPAPTAPPA